MSIFGPMVGRRDVQAATLATLQLWLTTYLAEWERAHHVRPRTLPLPPAPESLRGGIDFETFHADLIPMLTVTVKPNGDPERLDSGGYGQWYQVQVAALVSGRFAYPGSIGEEDSAELLADAYGTAIKVLLPQHGSLGKTVNRTLLSGDPELEFPNADARWLCRSITTFHVNVSPILLDGIGPKTVPADPYAAPGDYPTVQTVTTTVTAQPLG